MVGRIRFYRGIRLEFQDYKGYDRRIDVEYPETPNLAIDVEGDIYELSGIVAKTISELILGDWKHVFTEVSLVFVSAQIIFTDEKTGKFVSSVEEPLKQGCYIRVDYLPDAGEADLDEFVKLIDETFASLIIKAVQKQCKDSLKDRAKAERELERQTHIVTEFEKFLITQMDEKDKEIARLQAEVKFLEGK